MNINDAKKILLEFYEDYYEADQDEGRNYPDKSEQLKEMEIILQDYAGQIIDKGQWT